MPNPEQLPAGKLSNKQKRWMFFAVLGMGALIVLSNLTSKPPVSAVKATDSSAKQQQQNPTPQQMIEWQNNLTAAEAQLKKEQATRKQQEALAKSQGVTADDLSRSAQNGGGQNTGIGPSAQQASEADQAKAQLKAEREALAYKSLFADNLIHQDRSTGTSEKQGEAVSAGQSAQPEADQSTYVSPSALRLNGTREGVNLAKTETVSDTPEADNKRKPLDFDPSKQPTFWLPEGTVMEGVLTNKLDGEQPGPVNVMISAGVYLPSTRLLLIPQGARVLGQASKVSSFGQGRLAVAFHRILVPGLSNYSIPLDKAIPGLAQAGEVGLRGKVNSHYASIFGASLAVGAIGGLAQIGNAGSTYSSMGSFRDGVSQSTAQSADRILDRFLNHLPSNVIPEGARVRVLLTDDLQLPSYGSMHTGGF